MKPNRAMTTSPVKAGGTCTACNGTGKVKTATGSVPCIRCRGTKQEPGSGYQTK